MNRYMYHVLDTDEKVYANSGDEFEKIWMASHSERPAGTIKLVDMKTGEERMMYPIKF